MLLFYKICTFNYIISLDMLMVNANIDHDDVYLISIGCGIRCLINKWIFLMTFFLTINFDEVLCVKFILELDTNIPKNPNSKLNPNIPKIPIQIFCGYGIRCRGKRVRLESSFVVRHWDISFEIDGRRHSWTWSWISRKEDGKQKPQACVLFQVKFLTC